MPTCSRGRARRLLHEPAFAPARHNLARLELRAGDLERASAHYRTMLEQRPDDVHAMFGLATVAEMQQRIPDAIAWLEKIGSVDRGAISSQVHLVDL